MLRRPRSTLCVLTTTCLLRTGPAARLLLTAAHVGVFRNGACQWKMVPQQLSRLSFGESGCVLPSLLLSRVQTAH